MHLSDQKGTQACDLFLGDLPHPIGTPGTAYTVTGVCLAMPFLAASTAVWIMTLLVLPSYLAGHNGPHVKDLQDFSRGKIGS